MSFPTPPFPLFPVHASCPDPARHKVARTAAAAFAAVAIAVAVTYTVRFRSPDGAPADRGLMWLLAGRTWCIGAVAVAGIAALAWPARLHHTPFRWIALSAASGVATVLSGLVAEFGGYVFLDVLRIAS